MDDADLECVVAAILAAGALQPGAAAEFAAFKYRHTLDHLRDRGSIRDGARLVAERGVAEGRPKPPRNDRQAISDSDYDVFGRG